MTTKIAKIPKKRLTKAQRIALEKRRIRAREKAFQAMTKPQKRVAIAQDVIASMRAKKIIANRGTWVGGDVEDFRFEGKETKKQLRDVFVGEKCTACAVGAMFVCALERHDKLTIEDAIKMEQPYYCDETEDGHDRSWRISFDSHDLLLPYLKKFFSEEQIEKIECAFEIGSGGFGFSDENAAAFGSKFDYDADRMIGIMENIIANKGTFKPPKAEFTEEG